MILSQPIPIKCKLGDFGESRSKHLQTETLLMSNTVNVQRGTLSFMAPEQISKKQKLTKATQQELFLIDKWQLAMTIFCILNARFSIPFEKEISRLETDKIEVFKTFIANLLDSGRLPEFCTDYYMQQQTFWPSLLKAYQMLAQTDPSKRQSLKPFYKP